MRHVLILLASASALPACSQITHRGIEIERTETLTVAEAQLFLDVAGYESGPVDGIHGPLTEGALASFAAAEGLPGTAITPELSHRLSQRALRGDGSAGLGRSLAALAAETRFASVPAAQRALKDLGYRPGPVDGILGPRTAAALRAFQADAGLAITGRLDAQTAAKLSELARG